VILIEHGKVSSYGYGKSSNLVNSGAVDWNRCEWGNILLFIRL